MKMKLEEFDRGQCAGCDTKRPAVRIVALDDTPLLPLCSDCFASLAALFAPAKPKELRIATEDGHA